MRKVLLVLREPFLLGARMLPRKAAHPHRALCATCVTRCKERGLNTNSGRQTVSKAEYVTRKLWWCWCLLVQVPGPVQVLVLMLVLVLLTTFSMSRSRVEVPSNVGPHVGPHIRVHRWGFRCASTSSTSLSARLSSRRSRCPRGKSARTFPLHCTISHIASDHTCGEVCNMVACGRYGRQ